MTSRTAYSTSTPMKPTLFSGYYLRNRSTLDIGVLGYIGIVWPKEHSPEVRSFPPVTPCIYVYRKRRSNAPPDTASVASYAACRWGLTNGRWRELEKTIPVMITFRNKEFSVLYTVEHNYISPSSTVGIQLHVSALYVGHLQVVLWLTEQLYKMCGVFFEGIGGNEISLFLYWVSWPRAVTSGLSLVVCVYMS